MAPGARLAAAKRSAVLTPYEEILALPRAACNLLARHSYGHPARRSPGLCRQRRVRSATAGMLARCDLERGALILVGAHGTPVGAVDGDVGGVGAALHVLGDPPEPGDRLVAIGAEPDT